MERAATEVMQSIVFSAVLDAIAALKSASGGLPNQLLRDVQAIHANVTFADLPKELQDAIAGRRRTAEPCATARAGAARRATRTAKAPATGRAGGLAVRAGRAAVPRARASRRKASRG